jgi:hypothetical protein
MKNFFDRMDARHILLIIVLAAIFAGFLFLRAWWRVVNMIER